MTEQAGNVAAKSGATTVIRARVFSGPDGTGELLADLGTIVGPRTKEEEELTDGLLKMLAGRCAANKREREEMRNNG